MRGVGPFVSLGGHAVILFWGLVSFAPEPLESDFVEALPVEFVTIAEVTDLTKGVREAPEVIESEETVETPEVESEEISEAPGPAEKPVEEPEPIPVPDVAEKPVEATPAQPEPEPTPPEPVKDTTPPAPAPVPTPPKPIEEVKVEAEPEPEPEPEKPEPPKKAEVAPPKDPLSDIIEEAPEPEPIKEVAAAATAASTPPSAPAPRLNPRPKIKTAAKKPDLLDKKKPASNSGGKPKKVASRGTSTGRTGAKLTQTELDGLRDSIQRCWSLPPGYSAGRDFQAKVKARLSPDGRLKGRVNVVSVSGFDGSGGAFLVKNAVKVAIEKCQPYKLPASKYSEWENLEVTFYP